MNVAVGIALRFTLGSQDVATAIVGTTNPERWVQNAQHVAHGPLLKEEYEAIRARWKQVAPPRWIGQD